MRLRLRYSAIVTRRSARFRHLHEQVAPAWLKARIVLDVIRGRRDGASGERSVGFDSPKYWHGGFGIPARFDSSQCASN